METLEYASTEQLEAGMDYIRQSPKERGVLKMIVRRPQENERDILDEGELSLSDGLVGDTWKVRSSRHTPDGSPNTESQITIMNARAIELVAQDRGRWSLAGDQLYIDMDLSDENLPPGTRLAVGSAILEVSAQPHTGCKKFSDRFGVEAMKFVNSLEGKRLHLRGINTKVIQGGSIHLGDRVRKIDGTSIN